ncbi:MAG: hypothetical protein PW788_04940 [Micavibrio sp.]|nr:hypothetical protein [Micavibrio sp.]
MRKLKRWWQMMVAERRIAARRAVVLRALRHDLSYGPLQLQKIGNRGHDSNYIVSVEGRKTGVLRLVNPHRHRPLPQASSPAVLPPTPERLSREWQYLVKGAGAKLTPTPLWRTDDAIFCVYLPYGCMLQKLQNAPQDGWQIAASVCRRIADLHAAGITHMDMSMSNVIGNDNNDHIVFIDFEYGPAAGLPLPAQRLYDHLRLIESIWKFLPAGKAAGAQPWFAAFTAVVDDEMRAVDLAVLAPTLSRIFADEGFKQGLDRVLNAPKTVAVNMVEAAAAKA